MSDYAGVGDDALKQIWYAKPNDLIGGWCIMNVDKTPANADYRKGEFEIASFIGEQYARRIADLHNMTPVPTPHDEAAAKAFGEPIELLREWFEWWERDENVPVKMPNALHVRTACALYVATREHPLERRARKPTPQGGIADSVFRLRLDIGSMPADQHVADLRRVLDEFDDMRRYLHWELIEADAAASIDDDLTDDKMVAKRKPHVYLSTACVHDDHGYCKSDTGQSGAKIPAQCKFCQAPCTCACHNETWLPAATVVPTEFFDKLVEDDEEPVKRQIPKSVGMGKGPSDLSGRSMDPMRIPVVPLERLYALLDDLIDEGECVYHHNYCQTHGYRDLRNGEDCPQREAKEIMRLVEQEAQREAKRIIGEVEEHAAAEEERITAEQPEPGCIQLGADAVACINPEAAWIRDQELRDQEEPLLRRIRVNFGEKALDGCVRVKAPDDLEEGEAVVAYDRHMEADATVPHIRLGNPPRRRLAHLDVDFTTTRPVPNDTPAAP